MRNESSCFSEVRLFLTDSRTSVKTVSLVSVAFVYRHLMACLACFGFRPRMKALHIGASVSSNSGNESPMGLLRPIKVRAVRVRGLICSPGILRNVNSSFKMSLKKNRDLIVGAVGVHLEKSALTDTGNARGKQMRRHIKAGDPFQRLRLAPAPTR